MPSTPSDAALRALRVIAHNIQLARRFVADSELASFMHDERTIYAVTRCLEIISEASRRLPEELRQRHGHLPWVQIAGAGNVYRHDYEDVLPQILWNTVHEGLDELERVVLAELASGPGGAGSS